MDAHCRYKLEKLKENCLHGIPSIRRVTPLLTDPVGTYSVSDLCFLEKFLSESIPDSTQIAILLVLCRFGSPVSKYLDSFRKISSKMGNEIIKIAEQQNDPDTILEMVSEDKGNVNAAIIALKRMKKQEYLTSFLFSDNTDLVELIRDLEK